MRDVSIPTPLINAALAEAHRRGYDIHQWVKRAQISPRLLQEPNARVSASQYSHVQALAMKAMDDEMLGYGHKPVKVGTSSALSHWLISCRTFHQALLRLCHFYALLERGFKIEIAVRDQIQLSFQPWLQDKPIAPFAYETNMFGLHRTLCWLTAHNLPVQWVKLNYEQPQHPSDYHFMFPGAEVTFANQDSTCTLGFDRLLLELPIRRTPEELALFLRRPLHNILINAYGEQSWQARTRERLLAKLDQAPNLAEIANELGVHSKLLRRRLQEEGIEYQELKNHLRRDIAIHELTNSRKSIEQIAFITGFSEASTFIRSFKRWTGVTPFTYRRKISG